MKTGILVLASVLVVLAGSMFVLPVASIEAMGCPGTLCIILGSPLAQGRVEAENIVDQCAAGSGGVNCNTCCEYGTPCGNAEMIVGYPCWCTQGGRTKFCVGAP